VAFLLGIILLILPATSNSQAVQEKFGLRVILMYDGWRILHKLTYTAFICHYLVIFWYYSSIHSNGLILCKWAITKVTYGSLIMAYVFGFFYYMLIDKPIRNLDRLVLFPTKISDSFLVKRSNKGKGRKGDRV
jgi:peptidoglycan/LPS O-acetylase OafA/YrhL